MVSDKEFRFPKDIIFDQSTQDRSPSKDFLNLKVDDKKIMLTRWPIDAHNLKANVRPITRRDTLEDFQHSTELQNEIQRIFGRRVLDHVKGLCEGRYNYLCRLPDSIKMRIIDHLELEDFLNLAQTSKSHYKLCNGEKVWEQIVKSRSEGEITKDVRNYAKEVGWRKVFFTNKLQLRAKTRRHQQMMMSSGGDASGVLV